MTKLENIYQPIDKQIQKVEDLLKQQAQTLTDNSVIIKSFEAGQIKAVSHLFTQPGKRLRPALVLLCSLMLKPKQEAGPAHFKLAAAIETIHSASLVHDDIIDESNHRRQQMSLNRKYNNTTAVLMGDLLYAQFFKIIAGIKSLSEKERLHILDYLCSMTQKMCMGEIWQSQVQKNKIKITKEDYLKILEYKTATLMEASCYCGAIASEASPKAAEELKKWGYNFGIAYQLVDDYIDEDNIFELDLVNTAKHYLNKCQTSLNNYTPSIYRKSLIDLCDYMLERAQKKGPRIKKT